MAIAVAGFSSTRISVDTATVRFALPVPGTDTSIPIAVNIGSLPLPAGKRLEWRLFVDEETQDGWREPFRVRPE